MTTSRYELLYIIPTTFTDEEVGTVEQKIAALFTKVGATIDSTRRLGKFRLAYTIKTQRHGHYVLVMFTAEHGTVAKLDELLRITPEVLRHLIIRAEEGGEEAKFDLVQFTEIVVEGGREDRRRREKAAEAKDETKEELKDGVAALENKGEAKESAVAGISETDLETKIDTALNEDVKAV
jgi:small subunit ribosomal protein S6